MTDDFVSIGKIVSSHGLKGTVKIAHSGGVLADSPNLKKIYISGSDQTPISLNIASIESRGDIALVRFEGLDTIEKIEHLKGKFVYLDKKNFPKLQKDEFYGHQIIGLVPTEKSQKFSDFKIISIMENPAHPILVFSNGEKEILIPYVNRFIGTVNYQEGLIEVIDWQDWFISED